jgi:hypothetical protein
MSPERFRRAGVWTTVMLHRRPLRPLGNSSFQAFLRAAKFDVFSGSKNILKIEIYVVFFLDIGLDQINIFFTATPIYWEETILVCFRMGNVTSFYIIRKFLCFIE